MIDTLSTFSGTIWAWLNAEQNAGAVSALLAVMALAGSAGGWLWRRKSKAPMPDQTGGTHVSASTGGVGAGGSMTGNTITTNHGPTPDQIAAIFAGVRDLSQSSEAKAIAVADQFGTISREALTSFFTILRHEQVPPDQLTTKLTSIALQYREMVERLTALEQAAGPDDRPILTEARAAILQGEYNRAEHLLVGLESAQAAARAKAQANADELARHQATTRAERARLSALRFDYRAAADHFLAAANLLPVGDTEGRGSYLTDSADALVDYGEKQGNNNVLQVAIARYREALPPRHFHKKLWSRIQNNLGTALTTLGEHEEHVKGSALLWEAVDAFKNALLERTREDNPIDWAQAQNNLGAAYLSIGKRDNDRTLLWKGVDSLRNALLVYTQENAPIEWARTQNNLGAAFQILGQHEKHDATMLRQAKKFYTNALLEWTQARAPFDWATTQTNLGMIFRALGEREGDSALLRKAIDAYNSALLVRTRDRTPIDWAKTQLNRGNALQLLAKLSRDKDAANQAIAAQEAALEMFTLLNIPTLITHATHNLTLARATLAKLEGSADPAPHQ